MESLVRWLGLREVTYEYLLSLKKVKGDKKRIMIGTKYEPITLSY